MGKTKKYMISLVIMLVVSAVELLILGTITYFLKWQADKVMIGIVASYVLAGIAGGVMLKIQQAKDVGRVGIKGLTGTVLEAIILASVYIGVLFALAIFFFQTTPVLSTQLFMIYGLVVCGVFAGRLLAK